MGAMKLFARSPGPRLALNARAWLMAASLWLLLRRWYGERTANLGVLVLATSPFFFIGGQYINHDMLVAGTISAAVVGWLRALDRPGRVERRAAARLAREWTGLSLQGLIGVGAAAAGGRAMAARAAGAGAMRCAAHRSACWSGASWRCLGGGDAAAAPGLLRLLHRCWHFGATAAAASTTMQPLWFFLAVVPLLMLPWSLYLPAALRRLRGADARRAAVALVGGFAAAVLLAAFVKLVGYALPALPGVAGAGGARRRRRAGIGASPRCWVRPSASLPSACWLAGAQFAPRHRAGAAQRMQRRRSCRAGRGAFYDVPFYAQLRTPAIVASRWDDRPSRSATTGRRSCTTRPASRRRDRPAPALAGGSPRRTAVRTARSGSCCTRRFAPGRGDSGRDAGAQGARTAICGAPERATCAAAPR